MTIQRALLSGGASALLPGLGQAINGQRCKAIILLSFSAGLLIALPRFLGLTGGALSHRATHEAAFRLLYTAVAFATWAFAMYDAFDFVHSAEERRTRSRRLARAKIKPGSKAKGRARRRSWRAPPPPKLPRVHMRFFRFR